MKVATARLLLFLLWTAIWLCYVPMLFLTRYKSGVEHSQAVDAIWRVTYVFLPIVSAFASFWFGTDKGPPASAPPDESLIDRIRVIVMFTITGVVHFIVFLFFLFGVLLPDFADPDARQTYREGVEDGVRMMVLLSSVVALPVGFLLGKSITSSSPRQRTKRPSGGATTGPAPPPP